MTTPNKTNLGVGISIVNHLAMVELQRPPHNFFDLDFITAVADAYEELDRLTACRSEEPHV